MQRQRNFCVVFIWSRLVCSVVALSSYSLRGAPAQWKIPTRELAAPFPDGPCGGSIVTIPPSDTYAIDTRLAGNEFLLKPRPIQVWLPPGYSSQARYPVLYCHDGQNAVSDADSWTGRSWRLTGALTRLADHNKLQGNLPIVVLLPSADGDLLPGVRRRHLEYGDMKSPFAEAHVDFVALTVKPLIDSVFSTYTSSKDTYAVGTSMGGQASLHLMMRHPNKFGGAACLSPFFGRTTLDNAKNSCDLMKSKKLYLDIGGDIGEKKVPFFDVLDHWTNEHFWNPGYWWLDTQLQPVVEDLHRTLDAAGVPHLYLEIPGGRHNERAWSLRIDKPLLHLFGKQ